MADGITVRPFYLHSTCLAILDMEPGSVLPEHKHIHEQITFILKGELEITIDFNTRIVRKGELFSVRSNKPHSYRALGEPVQMVVASSPLLNDYVFSEE